MIIQIFQGRLIKMRFLLGFMAATFVAAAATAQVPHDGFQTSASFAQSAAKLLRMEHNESVNEAQILDKLTAPIVRYDRNGDGLDRDDPPVTQYYEIDRFLDAISIIDPTHQDRLTLEDAGVLAQLLVLKLDTNQDGLVTPYEIFDLMAAHQIPPEGTCDAPAVLGDAEVVLQCLGSLGGVNELAYCPRKHLFGHQSLLQAGAVRAHGLGGILEGTADLVLVELLPHDFKGFSF